MRSVTICVHCYAEELPQYAHFLRFQLSALIAKPPRTHTAVVVFYNRQDDLTRDVLDAFNNATHTLTVSSINMQKSHLFRRCIGRNWVAKGTMSDIVWFIDADFVISEETIDSLAEQFPKLDDDVMMVYPQEYMIQKTHAAGDRLVERVSQTPLSETSLVIPFREEFERTKAPRAFGPLHIVRGDYCRKYGYLDGDEKFQQPRTDSRPFGDFRDDVRFRRELETRGRIQAIDLPGIYRLRHTRTTYQEPKVTSA